MLLETRREYAHWIAAMASKQSNYSQEFLGTIHSIQSRFAPESSVQPCLYNGPVPSKSSIMSHTQWMAAKMTPLPEPASILSSSARAALNLASNPHTTTARFAPPLPSGGTRAAPQQPSFSSSSSSSSMTYAGVKRGRSPTRQNSYDPQPPAPSRPRTGDFTSARAAMAADEKAHQARNGFQRPRGGDNDRGGFNRNGGGGGSGGGGRREYRRDPPSPSRGPLRVPAAVPEPRAPNLRSRGSIARKAVPNKGKGAGGGGGKGGDEKDKDFWEAHPELDKERLKNIDVTMIERMLNEVQKPSKKITWDDIAGLEACKAALIQNVVKPNLRPDLYTGLRAPSKGVLLYGAPGTGKTLMAKCIASACDTTFFSISASSLTSKFIGEGEKAVKALFAVASCLAPSVVFVDEVDSLLTSRSEGENEASRRMKTEFLVALDGANVESAEERVLIVGATNRPQEIDEAARRRFQRRLYVPMPDEKARLGLIKHLLNKDGSADMTEEDFQEVVAATTGYSGADLNTLCVQASMMPMNEAQDNYDIETLDRDVIRKTQLKDFKQALKEVRSSVSIGELEHYLAWNDQYGSTPTPKSEIDMLADYKARQAGSK